MSLLVVVALAAGVTVAVWLARHRVALGYPIGIVGLALIVIAVAFIPPGATLELGGATLASTPYARLLLTLLAATGLLSAILAALLGTGPAAAAAWSAAVAAGLVALMSPSPVPGIWAILGATAAALGLPSVAVTGRERTSILRAALVIAAVAGAATVGAIAATAARLASGDVDPGLVGLAVLTAVTAVGLRGAIVPAHRWAPRLADILPGSTAAVVLGVVPALGVIVTLVWLDRAVSPLLLPLATEQWIIRIVALAAMLLAALAAWIQDDLRHIAVYLLSHGTALALLGLAALDPAAWAPTRTWVLVSVGLAAALLAWTLAVEARYRTRRIGDLRGWARRSPLLAIALVLVAIATLGLPGMAVFAARAALADLLGGPAVALGWLAVLAPVLPLGRLLAVGLERPGAAVRTGDDERPRRPEGPFGRRWLRAIVDGNRIPIVSVLVVTLALGAVLVSTGAFDLAAVAAGDPPAETPLGEDIVGDLGASSQGAGSEP